MISGSHIVIYSENPDADRDFLKDVLGLPNVDVGNGWLIFGLPPSEVAVHPLGPPGTANGTHEFYLMCNDIAAFLTTTDAKSIAHTEVDDQGWGLLSNLTLPGGGSLGVYQPRHARPDAPTAP
jgi:catechol 2,3-dioxygenase-like lactoylglutathione lyase family enzyme